VITMTENGIYENSHRIFFYEKQWFEHIWDFIRNNFQELITFFVLTGTLWGFVLVLTEALDNRAAIGEFALPVIIIGVLAVFYKAYIKCITYTPETLQEESDAVKIIFRKQKCGWQYALAWQMLSDRIGNINMTLERIDKGAEFIEPAYLTSEDYDEWLKLRPIALTRLVHASMIQCTDELPSFLATTKHEKQLTELKSRILALVQLYEHTKKYEIECYQIVPQEQFIKLHEMTYGWTHPIQEGINEFMNILLALANIDRKLLKLGEAQVPDFNIVIRVPDNVEEFCGRLDEIISQN